MERRTLEWRRTRTSENQQVHIQTMMRTDYTVQYGKVVFGTLHLEWLQENSIFDPHQHVLGRILTDAVAQAICTMRGLAPVHQLRTDLRA
jgi:hypothetical protein